MKKLSLVLALILVLTCSVLAACGDKTEESSAAESVAESTATSTEESTATSTEESTATSTEESVEASTEESTEASTEESVEESTPAEDVIPQGTAVDSPKGKNVALNKSYTGADVAITSGDGTPCGYSANLTDGQASAVGAYDNSWFAFWYNSDSSLPSNNAPGGIATVVVDLDKAVKDITAIRINLFNANTSGIVGAESIVAYVSEDNTNWTAVGYLALPETDEPAWASIAVDNATAQYVKLVIDLGTGGSWCFANEIEVYA